MAFLRCRYHQILGPCRFLPKFSNGLCRHADACVRFNAHFGRQAAESYVERSNAFALISGHRVLADPSRGTIERRDELATSPFDHLVGCHSRNGRYGIFGRDRADHSALMPANLITLAHFSVSSAMSLPKSAGEPASTVPPRSARRAFIVGSSRATLISRLSLSTISVGVFLGAAMPYSALDS